MKKWKIPLVLLLTLALLIAGAILPGIVAAVQDSTTVNQPGLGTIPSIELELTRVQTSCPVLGTLAMIREGQFYSIAESNAAMSTDEAISAVETALAPYYEKELIPYNWSDVGVSATPHLVYHTGNSTFSGILWVISIAWDSNAHFLDIYLDDATGKLVYLHFNSAQMDVYTPEAYAEEFCAAYFESTGLDDVLDDPEAYGVESITRYDSGLKLPQDKSIAYSLTSKEYGNLTLRFNVYERGFYLLIE